MESLSPHLKFPSPRQLGDCGLSILAPPIVADPGFWKGEGGLGDLRPNPSGVQVRSLWLGFRGEARPRKMGVWSWVGVGQLKKHGLTSNSGIACRQRETTKEELWHEQLCAKHAFSFDSFIVRFTVILLLMSIFVRNMHCKETKFTSYNRIVAVSLKGR